MVAHPGRQRSYEKALAMQEAGLLASHITCGVPVSLTSGWLRQIRLCLGRLSQLDPTDGEQRAVRALTRSTKRGRAVYHASCRTGRDRSCVTV